jgi:hypothetical protein
MSSFSLGYGIKPMRRTSLWIVASIALNLLMGGWILSWSLGLHTPPTSYEWQLGLRRSMSPADAAIVEETVKNFDRVREEAEPLVNADYDKLFAVLAKEPFDVDAANRALTDLVATRTNVKTQNQRFFLQELSDFSPAGRTAFLAAWQKQQSRVRANVR